MSELAKNQLDKISLFGGRIQCLIGILPDEQKNPQTLTYELSLFLDTRWAAKTGDVTDTVDYALIKNWVEQTLSEGQFGLLESAAQTVAIGILSPPLNLRQRIKKVMVRLGKPEIFSDSCQPELEIVRTLDEVTGG